MNAFEKLIEQTYLEYDSAGVARLMTFHPPTAPTGTRGKVPVFRRTGKGPFDVIGYFIANGRVIAAELKETATVETRMPIVGAASRGSGLQWHQLTNLVAVHQSGGLAMVLWNNGGVIGAIHGAALSYAMDQYEINLKREQNGYPYERNTRSIPWNAFIRVPINENNNLPLWLPTDPEAYGKSTPGLPPGVGRQGKTPLPPSRLSGREQDFPGGLISSSSE